MDYQRISTSAEVWQAIRKQHPEMVVFGSFSAPEGNPYGNPEESVMQTSYGFKHCDYPVIMARTTWRFDPSIPNDRKDEKHEFWLCCANKEVE